MRNRLTNKIKNIKLTEGITILTGYPIGGEFIDYVYKVSEGNSRFSTLSEVSNEKVITLLLKKYDNVCIMECYTIKPSDYQKCVQTMINVTRNNGKKIIICSNDYLLLKNCYVEAVHSDVDIKVIDFIDNTHFTETNIKDGISNNSVVDESIEVYKREIAL